MHAGVAILGSIESPIIFAVNAKQVQPFVPSLKTVPSAPTTEAKSPIKLGAAPVYALICHFGESLCI